MTRIINTSSQIDNDNKSSTLNGPSSNTSDSKTLPANWPTIVKCEMNIDAWSKALEKAGLMDEFKDVLGGCVNRFDQGIPHHKVLDLPFFTPPNHASAVLAAEKIGKNMKEEVLKRRMFGTYTHEEVKQFFFSSGLIHWVQSLRATGLPDQ